MGLFSKIKESLFKTRGNVGAKMDELVENTRELDDDFYDDLTDIMVMADVGVKTAEEAVNKLRDKCNADKIGDPARANRRADESGEGPLWRGVLRHLPFDP